jgi:hypothetical protein
MNDYISSKFESLISSLSFISYLWQNWFTFLLTYLSIIHINVPFLNVL